MKFYSKEGQDRWVFEVLNKKKSGFFVDIGAHDGISNSNSFFFEKNGWSGICVEPNERSFLDLDKNRKCFKENICIFDKTCKVDFISRGRHKELSGIVYENSSFYIKEALSKNHPIIQKNAMSLIDLLDKYNSPKIIDYISIDTEGSEYDIIKDFDFKKYKFLTISIEHNFFEKGNFDENSRIKKLNIQNLLETNDYILSKTVTADDWYIHKSIV